MVGAKFSYSEDVKIALQRAHCFVLIADFVRYKAGFDIVDSWMYLHSDGWQVTADNFTLVESDQAKFYLIGDVFVKINYCFIRIPNRFDGFENLDVHLVIN